MHRLSIVFLLLGLSAPNRAAAQTLRIALVGQSLIHEDLRRVAPLAVEQAKGYLQGVDVGFTNLETALAAKNVAVEPRTPRYIAPAPKSLTP
jgi:hypothetical protein